MNKQIKQSLTRLSVASDIYRVPLAATVIGWLVGAGRMLQTLDWIGRKSSLRLALAVSLFFVCGTQMLVAALLFLPPGTTLLNKEEFHRMKCEKCQSELRPDARFCSACEHPVPIVASPLPADRGGCPNCGAKRQSDERFCGECGQALSTASPKSPAPASTPDAAPKRRRWTYTLGTMVGIAIFVGVGFIGYQFFSEGGTGAVGHGLRFWADSLVARLRDNPFPQDSR